MKKSTILIAAICGIILCSCGKNTDNYPSSQQCGLYIASSKAGDKYVVDDKGLKSVEYEVNGDGDIVMNKKVIVPNEKTKEFKYVTSIVPTDNLTEIEVELERKIVAGTVDTYETEPVTEEYKVYISPSDANITEIRVTSSDNDIAELIPNNGTQNADKSVTYNTSAGVATLYIKCSKKGTATLNISATDNSGKSLCVNVKVTEKKNETGEESEETAESIESTENTPGWVVGTNVRFRKSPGSDGTVIAFFNSGKEVTILGTSESGWIKCQADNQTGYIKSEFISRTQIVNVTPTPTSSTSPYTRTSTPTPVPTATAQIASNDGQDHGYAYGSQTENKINVQEKKEEASEHTHYYIKYKVVQQTATEKGYTVYRCECGASYKTNYTDPEE